MDVRVRHHLDRRACIEVVSAGYPAKFVRVVASQIRKNFAGVNMGRVIGVMYDMDDRTYKKNLIKVKSLFGGAVRLTWKFLWSTATGGTSRLADDMSEESSSGAVPRLAIFVISPP
jgi:hypothetical protein